MYLTRKPFSRRTVLKGAGAAIALPLLDAMTPAAADAASNPIVLYTDIVTGPTSGGEGNNGCYLSIFGRNFGSVQTNVSVTIGGRAVAAIKYFGASKGRPDIQQVTVQVGSLGGAANGTSLAIKVTVSAVASNTDLTFTPAAGRMIFIDYTQAVNGTGSFASPYNNIDAWLGAVQAGDHCVFRAATVSTYSTYNGGVGGSPLWPFAAACSGTASQYSGVMAYPGETVTLQIPVADAQTNVCISFAGSNYYPSTGYTHDAADYFFVSGFNLKGGAQALEGGGTGDTFLSPGIPTSDVRCKGSKYLRVVNNDMTTQYTGDTQTGALTIKGDYDVALGNTLHDVGNATAIYTTNHVIYHQVGASNVDIGWNYCRNNNVGFVIQTHTDTSIDAQHVYANIRRHDNLITHTNSHNCRGFSWVNTYIGSTGSDYNNILVNVGESFSAFTYYTGWVKNYNNTCWNIDADIIDINDTLQGGSTRYPAGSRQIDCKNNIYKCKNSTNSYLAIDPSASTSDVTGWDYNCLIGGASPGTPITGAHSVYTAPTFVNNAPDPANPQLYDFHEIAGSSCVDTGVDTSATVARDYYGTPRPQGVAVDIGASER